MSVEHVSGRNAGRIMLYALSTCGWCRKTRQFLESLGVAYNYTYVDLLQGTEQDLTMNEVKKLNPSGTFPTIVINDRKTIVGYREEEICQALKA